MSESRFVSPVERLMYLSKLSIFATLDPHELATLALHAEERSFPRGEQLLREGRPVDSVIALVSGQVEVRRRGTISRAGPGTDVGSMALLARSASGVEAVARTPGVALMLAADALYDIFEDHFAILDGAMQATAEILRRDRGSAGAGEVLPSSSAHPVALPERELDLVERMFLLRRSMPFAATGITGLGELAQRCDEVRHTSGEVLWEPGSPPEHMLLIVAGSVVCRSSHQEFRRGAGDGVGVIDLVARTDHDHEVRTEKPTVALSIARDAYLDVLEDHFELGVAALAGLARMVLHTSDHRTSAGSR